MVRDPVMLSQIPIFVYAFSDGITFRIKYRKLWTNVIYCIK